MPRFKQRTNPYSVDYATAAGVLVANSSSLNPTDVVALEAWVRPQAAISSIVFDNSQSGVTLSYFLSIDGANGRVSWFSTIGGVSRNIVNVFSVKPGVWNFVGASYDGSVVNVYVNGSTVSTLSTSGSLGVNTGQLRIGQYVNAGVPSFGRLLLPRVYHRAYTLTDHQQRYYENRDDAVMRSGLVLEMLMTEGSGSSVADTSGQSNNGTFSRAVWFADTPFKDRSAVANRSSAASRSAASGRVLIT